MKFNALLLYIRLGCLNLNKIGFAIDIRSRSTMQTLESLCPNLEEMMLIYKEQTDEGGDVLSVEELKSTFFANNINSWSKVDD